MVKKSRRKPARALKKAAQIKSPDEGNIILKNKFIILVIAAALFYCAAYLLKYPNTYSVAIGLIFLALLIKNLKSEKGAGVISYYLGYSILVYAAGTFFVSVPLLYQTAVLLINTIVVGFMIFGLIKRKKWAPYYITVISTLSAISLIASYAVMMNQIPEVSLPLILFTARGLISLLMIILSIVYVLKNKKLFRN